MLFGKQWQKNRDKVKNSSLHDREDKDLLLGAGETELTDTEFRGKWW